MSLAIRSRIRAEMKLEICRVCGADRKVPGMTLGPVVMGCDGDTVHVCGKCLLDMIRKILKATDPMRPRGTS
jgi:hypothetical protein